MSNNKVKCPECTKPHLKTKHINGVIFCRGCYNTFRILNPPKVRKPKPKPDTRVYNPRGTR